MRQKRGSLTIIFIIVSYISGREPPKNVRVPVNFVKNGGFQPFFAPKNRPHAHTRARKRGVLNFQRAKFHMKHFFKVYPLFLV